MSVSTVCGDGPSGWAHVMEMTPMARESRDFLTQAERSRLMKRVRSKHTAPEVRLREALERAGVAFETHASDLPGHPDVVIREERVAVFVDGEFWHGAQWKRRGLGSLAQQFPDSRKRGKWIRKIDGNVRRDLSRTAELVGLGWRVVRVWAEDVTRDAEGCVRLVREAIRAGASAARDLPGRRFVCDGDASGLMAEGLSQAGWNEAAGAEGVALRAVCVGEHDDWRAALKDVARQAPPLLLVDGPSPRGKAGREAFVAGLDHLAAAGYQFDAFEVNESAFVPRERFRVSVVGVHRAFTPLAGCAAVSTVLRPRWLCAALRRYEGGAWAPRPVRAPRGGRSRWRPVVDAMSKERLPWWSESRVHAWLGRLEHVQRRAIMALSAGTRARVGLVHLGSGLLSTSGRAYPGMFELWRGGSVFGVVQGRKNTVRIRSLTAAELATIMGVSESALESWVAGKSDQDVARDLASGACAPRVRWIGEQVMTPLVVELVRGRVLMGGARPA